MDEERLLEGLRFGDPGAFKKLFDRYWEDLFAAAKYRLPNHNKPRTWYRIYSSIYGNESPPYPFMSL